MPKVNILFLDSYSFYWVRIQHIVWKFNLSLLKTKQNKAMFIATGFKSLIRNQRQNNTRSNFFS